MEQFKVMVTGVNDGLLWNIIDETNIDLSHDSYKALNEEFDLSKWKQDYIDLYRRWLDFDDENIYDINHPINTTMIEVLKRINKNHHSFKLYLWFDVDRDRYPQFVWETCPISNAPLTTLPGYFSRNNRKISPTFPLIFPSNE